MRAVRRWLVGAVLVLVAAPSWGWSIAEMEPLVCGVSGAAGHGTGTYVRQAEDGSGGYVLTARHVVAGVPGNEANWGRQAVVQFGDVAEPAIWRFESIKDDLALLKVPSLRDAPVWRYAATPLPLLSYAACLWNDHGDVLASLMSVSARHINIALPDELVLDQVAFNSSAAPGASGGLIVNQAGEIVSVVSTGRQFPNSCNGPQPGRVRWFLEAARDGR